MKPIQRANLDNALKRINEAKEQGDESAYDDAKISFENTLEAIKNIDSKTYEEYKPFIEGASPFQQ